jgi:hypothetical protein
MDDPDGPSGWTAEALPKALVEKTMDCPWRML